MSVKPNIRKILVICPYPEGVAATQRLKYEQYFDTWKKDGFDITISPFFSINTWNILYEDGNLIKKIVGTIQGYFKRLKDIFRIRKYEKIYVCMWVTPFFDTFFERIFFCLTPNIIYDFDDAIHVEEDPSAKNSFRSFFKSKKKVNLLIKKSCHVITSSPFNLDYCVKNNQSGLATYIPCSLDVKRFLPKCMEHNNTKISIGWTGTFSSKSYLDSISDVLRSVCLKLDIKLVLITNFDYVIKDIDMEVIKWSERTEISDLQKIDIGLYPIMPSNWALGKGGLKVLQYMAIGIPSISTNFGTATKIVSNGIDGFLVDTLDEWIQKISLLVKDENLRKEMGHKGREKIIEKYSVEAVSKSYLSVLNQSQFE